MAAKSLPRLDARPKPVNRKVFEEAAEFDRGADVAEAVQFDKIVGFS